MSQKFAACEKIEIRDKSREIALLKGRTSRLSSLFSLLFGHFFNRTFGRFPAFKTGADVRNIWHPHILQSLGSQSRPPTSCSVEDKFVTFWEHPVLVIGAVRVNPELKHPARGMLSTRNLAVAP